MKKNPYRYRELISELNDLVSNGDLLPDDEIQVLRETSGYRGDYRPIIEWYYCRDVPPCGSGRDCRYAAICYRHARPDDAEGLRGIARALGARYGEKASLIWLILFWVML